MTTYTSQPDETSGTDTFLSSNAPTTNYGTDSKIEIGENNALTNYVFRGLIKFDLSSIPANSSITSAILSLWTETDYSSNARTLSAYRVLRAWSESQATWNVYTTGNNWGTAGCANTTTDRESASIGSAAVGASVANDTEIQITLDPLKVQEWVSGAFTNNGLLLRVDVESDDEYRYDSSSSTTANQRPKLVIEYIDITLVAGSYTSTGYSLDNSLYTELPKLFFKSRDYVLSFGQKSYNLFYKAKDYILSFTRRS